MREFAARGLDSACAACAARAPPRATSCESFHTPAYVDLVRERSPAGRVMLDAGDTPAWRGVLRGGGDVVGATLLAADAIMAGRARRAFIPIAGLHHAARDHAAGFCVFNDCGVAIEMLRRKPRPEAHRVRRHRCAPRRRRVLRVRETTRT